MTQNSSHPLDGDGISPLFFNYLCKKPLNEERRPFPFKVPDTIVFRSFPIAWYYWRTSHRPDPANNEKKDLESDKGFGPPPSQICGEVRRKAGRDLEKTRILQAFADLHYDPVNDISAVFISTESSTSKMESICFLSYEDLVGFLDEKHTGILQVFVLPNGEYNEVVQATWSPNFCMAIRRRNRIKLSERSQPSYTKAITYHGPSHYSDEHQVTSFYEQRIREVCQSVVDHFSTFDNNYSIQGMVLYIKEDKYRSLWLMHSGSFRFFEGKSQNKFQGSNYPIYQDRSPLSLSPSTIEKSTSTKRQRKAVARPSTLELVAHEVMQVIKDPPVVGKHLYSKMDEKLFEEQRHHLETPKAAPSPASSPPNNSMQGRTTPVPKPESPFLWRKKPSTHKPVASLPKGVSLPNKLGHSTLIHEEVELYLSAQRIALMSQDSIKSVEEEAKKAKEKHELYEIAHNETQIIQNKRKHMVQVRDRRLPTLNQSMSSNQHNHQLRLSASLQDILSTSYEAVETTLDKLRGKKNSTVKDTYKDGHSDSNEITMVDEGTYEDSQANRLTRELQFLVGGGGKLVIQKSVKTTVEQPRDEQIKSETSRIMAVLRKSIHSFWQPLKNQRMKLANELEDTMYWSYSRLLSSAPGRLTYDLVHISPILANVIDQNPHLLSAGSMKRFDIFMQDREREAILQTDESVLQARVVKTIEQATGKSINPFAMDGISRRPKANVVKSQENHDVMFSMSESMEFNKSDDVVYVVTLSDNRPAKSRVHLLVQHTRDVLFEMETKEEEKYCSILEEHVFKTVSSQLLLSLQISTEETE